MCGILGGFNTRFTSDHLARLRHRGPDQQHFESIALADGCTIDLGQNRLNIVDRDDVDLPVRIGRASILFNGEIYNYVELRDELRRLGWSFETRTDTEVALAAYLQWGAECLNRFNGMFAMVVWDGDRLFCARDRLGKKPLYCRHGPHRLEFASEIKAFDGLELVTLDSFDLFEFTFDDRTIYRDVFAVKPGHYLTYDVKRGMWSTRAYWDIEHQVGSRIDNPRRAVRTFLELLEDAVRLRMRADVPVTLFLSGGVDSSLLAALSGVRETFTCQFDEFRALINEERFVTDLASRLDLHAHIVRPTREQFFRDLPQLSRHLEIPTGSFSAFPLYRLAAACHQHGYKVVLSGEGADELFAGYARNAFLMDDAGHASDDRHRHYASMLDRYQGSLLDQFCRMASRSGLAGAAMMKAVLHRHWDDRRSPLDNLCYLETRVFLQPLLQMSDRMCMAHSVEARCPFLDHRLVEFAFSLDDSLRLRDGIGKWIVQEAARKVLPRDALVLQRTVKDGLPAPINQWIQGRHSFDRKYWNTLMMAECIKNLLSDASPVETDELELKPPRMPAGGRFAPRIDLTEVLA